jgi:hypothetical protein
MALMLEEDPALCFSGPGGCDGCPDTKFEPPYNTDCEFYDEQNGIPTCTREDGFQREVEGLLASVGPRLGQSVCPSLVEVAGQGVELPVHLDN